jgi:hypothetical protein
MTENDVGNLSNIMCGLISFKGQSCLISAPNLVVLCSLCCSTGARTYLQDPDCGRCVQQRVHRGRVKHCALLHAQVLQCSERQDHDYKDCRRV